MENTRFSIESIISTQNLDNPSLADFFVPELRMRLRLNSTVNPNLGDFFWLLTQPRAIYRQNKAYDESYDKVVANLVEAIQGANLEICGAKDTHSQLEASCVVLAKLGKHWYEGFLGFRVGKFDTYLGNFPTKIWAGSYIADRRGWGRGYLAVNAVYNRLNVLLS